MPRCTNDSILRALITVVAVSNLEVSTPADYQLRLDWQAPPYLFPGGEAINGVDPARGASGTWYVRNIYSLHKRTCEPGLSKKKESAVITQGPWNTLRTLNNIGTS